MKGRVGSIGSGYGFIAASFNGVSSKDVLAYRSKSEYGKNLIQARTLARIPHSDIILAAQFERGARRDRENDLQDFKQ
ncbi:MAG TPA: hypothetical protein VK651_03405 [Blastocatellia bacterium]|nr:hypothetical protein [Blastocatellia bacterium]